VTRKKRSASSTGSSADARLSDGRDSSAGGGGDLCPTTVEDGREVDRTGTGTTSAGWRRYARPDVGNVRQAPRCFHLDSVPPENDDGFLLAHSLIALIAVLLLYSSNDIIAAAAELQQ